jgi:hypothetical protein
MKSCTTQKVSQRGLVVRGQTDLRKNPSLWGRGELALAKDKVLDAEYRPVLSSAQQSGLGYCRTDRE